MTKEERAFLIQALRYWQVDQDKGYIRSPFSSKQIDELCERLNCGEKKSA
jgi:hypothetical protein